MPPYLLPPEYADYGIPDATAGQVAGASSLIDSYLGASQGLIYNAGADGRPCYMAGATPSSSYALATALPASSTALTIPNAQFPGAMAGDVAVIDRANPALTEACVVTSATSDTLTLQGVQFTHQAGAPIEFGLTAVEYADLSRDGLARAKSRPVARVLSVAGVYAPKPGLARDPFNPYRYSAAAYWTAIPTNLCDIDGGTCRLLSGGDYTRLRMHLVTGWTQANLPAAVKQAVAATVRAQIDNELPSGVKMLKAGDSTIERFTAAPLASDALALLSPYKTYRL